MKIKNWNWFLLIALVLATILRLWNLGTNPPGLTPDEAALGYNAYSILHTGKDEEEEAAGELHIFKAVGCKKCKGGYKGRVGIYEVMPISKRTGEIIMNGGTSLDVANQALKENIWFLRKAGLHKVKKGLTSLEEISRVTRD